MVVEKIIGQKREKNKSTLPSSFFLFLFLSKNKTTLSLSLHFFLAPRLVKRPEAEVGGDVEKGQEGDEGAEASPEGKLEVPVVHRARAVGDERALCASHPPLLRLSVVVDQVVDLGLGRAQQRGGQAALRLVNVVLHLVDREPLEREARVGQEREVAQDGKGDLEDADVEAAEEDGDGDVGDGEDVGDVLFVGWGGGGGRGLEEEERRRRKLVR